MLCWDMGLPDWLSAFEGTREEVEQQDDLVHHVITRATLLLLVCAWQASYLLLRWPASMKTRNCLTTAIRVPQQHQPLPSPPRHHYSRAGVFAQVALPGAGMLWLSW